MARREVFLSYSQPDIDGRHALENLQVLLSAKAALSRCLSSAPGASLREAVYFPEHDSGGMGAHPPYAGVVFADLTPPTLTIRTCAVRIAITVPEA